jgi:predicted Zn-dependent protease
MEIEADFIGIMLLGAAGFDPHWALVALVVTQKFEERVGLKKFLSPHPMPKKRLELLSEAKTMDKALELYREATAMDKVTNRYFR